MKYCVLVGDGMGDYPRPELGGKTPLEAARTPHMDRLASQGALGLARTIPGGMEAGSDVANMSILGYDPAQYHTGRSPLEAASMGVELASHEVAFRLNLVTLEFAGPGRVIMRDHAAGNITTAEAARLVADLAAGLPFTAGQRLYPGVSYRHLMVWPGASGELSTIAPHDWRDKNVAPYLAGQGEIKPVLELIRASWPLLENHALNQDRRARGLRPANSIWPWGQGRPPAMPTYQERFGLTGAVVSAVDLIKGLGVYAGLEPLDVPGATGLIDTDYEAKVAAALGALQDSDFALIHVEAPDEAAHQGDLKEKIQAIELFDARVVGPMAEGLARLGAFRLLVLCDHFTPLAVQTHTPEPVPFILYPAGQGSGRAYTEANAAQTGLSLERGHELIQLLLERNQ